MINKFAAGILLAFILCSSCVVSTKKLGSSPRSLERILGRIVIDPGHGGHDSGALGQNGLSEKKLTLDIALRIKKLMHQVMPGVEVILTRTSDKYISLEDRVKIANNSRADLFVSVHINSSDNQTASGFEVYSLDVASDRHAERLAARENASFKGEQKNLNYILADLRAHDYRAKSDILAANISAGLSAQLSKKVSSKYINDRGYNQAIFHVLFVKMPAVLTELFFITNQQEERMLKHSTVRELCARGIVSGIRDFLVSKNSRVKHAG